MSVSHFDHVKTVKKESFEIIDDGVGLFAVHSIANCTITFFLNPCMVHGTDLWAGPALVQSRQEVIKSGPITRPFRKSKMPSLPLHVLRLLKVKFILQ